MTEDSSSGQTLNLFSYRSECGYEVILFFQNGSVSGKVLTCLFLNFLSVMDLYMGSQEWLAMVGEVLPAKVTSISYVCHEVCLLLSLHICVSVPKLAKCQQIQSKESCRGNSQELKISSKES